ncbi:MAG TPA: G1 family glutamic endopeptidase, partial [Terriglobia bacterium]|nr:G1 family glutamic endopeptidase [Terriglobia bacterium]
WNGIDGDLDGNALLQGGTLSGVSCSNPYGWPLISTSYYAWLEWWPAYPIIATFDVNPGDDFFVETYDTTATQGYVWLEDETLGISAIFGITSSGGPGLIGNSAEYIVERPCCIGSNSFPLANYVQNFWVNSDAETFYEYAKGLATPWYPGSTLTNNVLAIMVDDSDTHNISVPQALGKYGIFFQAESCAYSGGCTP